MKRFKHNLSSYHLTSMDMGYLVPVNHYEVLPGDTVQQATSALVRFAPMLAPVMHPIQVRLHHFFVPYRLIFDEVGTPTNGKRWEDFITGVSSDTPPIITATPALTASGQLLNYLGVPPVSVNTDINAMPIHAYNFIFNEYYRDQDLVSEVALNSTALQRCAWQKDYFSSARPWPQKGSTVSIPLIGAGSPSFTYDSNGAAAGELQYFPADDRYGPDSGSSGAQTSMNWDDPKLSMEITALRDSLALQRFEEARAQYGSRYTEYLAYLGIKSADSRLQRPEYLGGGKATIAFSEVLQTGPDSTDDGVATMRGHGISALRTRRFRRFFSEHGIVMTLMSVRPKTIYANALHRSWLRKTMAEYWQREFERVGQQEITTTEIFAENGIDSTVFGYQDRYAEYRSNPSIVTGDFRSSLNFWHEARDFSSAPVLNPSFVSCAPSDRIFAVPGAQNLWCMINHSVQARRPVTKHTIGRVL